MKPSAELRWFWPDGVNSTWVSWFRSADVHGCAAGGGEDRCDEYLRDVIQDELSVKRRGNPALVEVKGLVIDAWTSLDISPFSAPIQLWCKWPTHALELPPERTIVIIKQRWLRKFAERGAELPLGPHEAPLGATAIPDVGCNVELTRIRLANGPIWWTLGFESFGPIETLQESLSIAAATLAMRRTPAIGAGQRLSYPAWLRRIGTES